MKKTILIVILVALFGGLKAQQVIYPGQSKVIKAKDTLVVINIRQFNNTIKVAGKYEYTLREINLYKQQIENLKEQLVQKDTMYSATVEMMNKYKSNWDTCKQDLETVSKKYKACATKQRIFFYGGIAASVVSFVLGAVIF